MTTAFTELTLRNFKSFREATVPLSPGITVFVGANNSGKSSALAAFRLLSLVFRTNGGSGTDDLSPSSIPCRRGDGTWSVGIAQTAGHSWSSYSIARQGTPGQLWEEVRETPIGAIVEPKGNNAGHIASITGSPGIKGPPGTWMNFLQTNAHLHPPSALLGESLLGMSVFDLRIGALRKATPNRPGVLLEGDGTNLGAVLDLLANERPEVFEAITDEVRSAAPEVKKLTTPNGDMQGTKTLGIQELDGQVYRSEQISDGLLLFVGIATALHMSARRPTLVAIEEPERGIHPRRITDVVDYFRRMSQRGTQVVLTTHSPLVLDEFRDEPDSVLLFDRDADGSHVRKLTDVPDWEKSLQGKPLGDLWYSGLLGGVPRR